MFAGEGVHPTGDASDGSLGDAHIRSCLRALPKVIESMNSRFWAVFTLTRASFEDFPELQNSDVMYAGPASRVAVETKITRAMILNFLTDRRSHIRELSMQFQPAVTKAVCKRSIEAAGPPPPGRREIFLAHRAARRVRASA